MDDVDFVDDDDDRDAEVHFEYAFTERHLQSDIDIFLAHVAVIITTLSLFLALDYQVTIIVELGLLICEHVPFYRLLHLLRHA